MEHMGKVLAFLRSSFWWRPSWPRWVFYYSRDVSGFRQQTCQILCDEWRCRMLPKKPVINGIFTGTNYQPWCLQDFRNINSRMVNPFGFLSTPRKTPAVSSLTARQRTTLSSSEHRRWLLCAWRSLMDAKGLPEIGWRFGGLDFYRRSRWWQLTPNPGEMIQFDLRIFFKWVGKNHQLEMMFGNVSETWEMDFFCTLWLV